MAGKANRSFIKPIKINGMIPWNVSETGKYLYIYSFDYPSLLKYLIEPKVQALLLDDHEFVFEAKGTQGRLNTLSELNGRTLLSSLEGSIHMYLNCMILLRNSKFNIKLVINKKNMKYNYPFRALKKIERTSVIVLLKE